MTKKIILLALCSMLLAPCFPTQAQQQAQVPKIGYLGARPPAPGSGYEVFRREIRVLGYIEGKNIVIGIDPLIISSTGFPPWLMSWSVSRLT